MANAFKQIDMLAAEALTHLEDSLVIGSVAARDLTAEFNEKPNGYAKGDTIGIKVRPDYHADEFTGTVTPQDIRESRHNLTIEKHFDITVELTAKEKALSFESFVEQVVNPASYRLAEKVDAYLGQKLTAGAHGLYTSASPLGTKADMAQARKAATIQQLGQNRLCLMGLDLEATMLGNDYISKFNDRGAMGSLAFQEASLGRAMGMEFAPSINFDETAHTNGTAGGIITNSGGGANNLVGDTALVVDGGTGVDIKAGDRLIIAGLRRPLLVASDFNSASGSIALAWPITEEIADNAAITIAGGDTTIWTPRGAIMDTNAVAIAMPLLDPAEDKPSMVLSNNGVSIRIVSGYDMMSKKSTMSFDCLVGGKVHDGRRVTLLGQTS